MSSLFKNSKCQTFDLILMVPNNLILIKDKSRYAYYYLFTEFHHNING